jgi:hypothetical protein
MGFLSVTATTTVEASATTAMKAADRAAVDSAASGYMAPSGISASIKGAWSNATMVSTPV